MYVSQFMNKMMEIDALSPSTADSNEAGGESSRTHFDSSADRPLTSSDPPGDSNEPRGMFVICKFSCASFTWDENVYILFSNVCIKYVV